jgi:hypothetical protein
VEIGKTVMCFERHVSELVFQQQQIRNFVGNRLVEIYVHVLQASYGATSQKTAFFIVTAVNTSNVT